MARLLGLPTNVEVFPKQDKLDSPDDVGNWINLPYYGGSSWVAVTAEGQELPLAAFWTRRRQLVDRF
jgi:hypothetical protein